MKAKYMISCAVAALYRQRHRRLSPPTRRPQHHRHRGGHRVRRAPRPDVQTSPTPCRPSPDSALADLNLTTFDSLLRYTPNVTYGNNGPGQGEIIMRGLSNGFPRQPVQRHDRATSPMSRSIWTTSPCSFPARNVDIYMVDMDRVEVLEGPQGTLFGGGAEAGAVRYITNKPKLDSFEGKAEASYGFTSGGADNSSRQPDAQCARSWTASWPCAP